MHAINNYLTLLSATVALQVTGLHEVKEPAIRKELYSKSQKIARVLKWPSVENPSISDQNFTKGLEVYTVNWQGGWIMFSRDRALRKCFSMIPRPFGNFRNPPPIPKLSATDIKRAQATARSACLTLGIGTVSSFKELKSDRTRDGMYYPAIRVECLMQVKSKLPIHEVSTPLTRMEIEPVSFRINSLTPPLPVIVKPLETPQDDSKAKDVVSEYLKRQRGISAQKEKMTVRLCLVDWPEGDYNSLAVKRLYSLRRQLIPIYCYKDQQIGEVWIDANSMKFLAVRENYPKAPVFKRGTPP